MRPHHRAPCDVDGTIFDENGSPTDDHRSRLPSARSWENPAADSIKTVAANFIDVTAAKKPLAIMHRSCAGMATTQLCLRHDFYSRRWPTQAHSHMLRSKRVTQTISACLLAAAISGIGPSVGGADALGARPARSRRGSEETIFCASRNHFR